MIPLSPDARIACSKCGGLKHWSEFPVVDRLVNRVSSQCKQCKRSYQLLYNNTPHGIAVKMYNSILSRAGNKDGKHSTYKNVEMKLTKSEWLTWAEPRIADFLRSYPGERPSVDRIDNRGHYEASNMRIISWSEHRKLKKAVRWQRYVAYLRSNPAKLEAFVSRHRHKLEKETDPQQLLSAVETLIGHQLNWMEKSTIEAAISNPTLLLNLMFVIDNAH